jgi:fumarate reductase subunit C
LTAPKSTGKIWELGGLLLMRAKSWRAKTPRQGKETKMGESLITLALWLAKVHVIVTVVVVVITR